MRGVFVTYGKINTEQPTGIEKKISSQTDVFNTFGLDCDLYSLYETTDLDFSILDKIINRLPFTNRAPRWIYDDVFCNVKYIYMRRPPCITGAMRHCLKRIRRYNPRVKIVMEIPTYPYDNEYNRTIDFPLIVRDRFNRKKLKGLIDTIAVVSEKDNLPDIWGIPAIPFINGYDVLGTKPRKKTKLEGSSINLICIAIFAFWHGYERLLEGLANYYEQGGKRNVIVHFVGDGPELPKYKRISTEMNLENHIVFHGRLTGMDLDAVYDISDIAVTSLGLYKNDKNIVGSFLKSREYLAKGLPMITGCKIDVFLQHEFPYYIEFPNDSTPLDVEQIVTFYDNIYHGSESAETVISNIREYALNTVDIRKTMQPIIDYLRSETS